MNISISNNRTLRAPFSFKEPTLAVGADGKAAFAFGRENNIILSEAFGNLEDVSVMEAFEKAIRGFEREENVKPALLVSDIHPEYLSTKYTLSRAVRDKIPHRFIQHHQAHIAAAVVEAVLNEPGIGVAWDGLGYGLDGVLWGSEFFTGGYSGFQRKAHLETVPMPGGRKAVEEPWRMALSYLSKHSLVDSFKNSDFFTRVPQEKAKLLLQMIEQKLNCPLTTGMGRLFDAVSSLIGVKDSVSYEGEAAIYLEKIAGRGEDAGYEFLLRNENEELVIGTELLFRGILKDLESGLSQSKIAGKFHVGLARVLLKVVSTIAQSCKLKTVILCGGVFLNKYLLELAVPGLEAAGFKVIVPSPRFRGDGALAVGQLALTTALSSKPAYRQAGYKP
ncbi:MAG: hypothetical protein PHE61_03590 [Candidatus Omnitrophica bacterium]|nr:hypothetical protein [Candidatus Omnitrophota bacterium]